MRGGGEGGREGRRGRGREGGGNELKMERVWWEKSKSKHLLRASKQGGVNGVKVSDAL